MKFIGFARKGISCYTKGQKKLPPSIMDAHSRIRNLANLGCLIINGSYLLLLQTESADGALAALKMEYFGNVVFYLMFALFLWSYLKIKGYLWVKILFAFWAIQDIAFLFCIWSGRSMQNVFASLEFKWNERLGLVLVQAAPGTLYMVRYCIICAVLFCGMIYTTVRMFLVKLRSERNNLARLAGAQFVICVSLRHGAWAAMGV